MIVDGRALAKEVLARTKECVQKLARAPRILAIVVNETPATQSYLRIKAARAVDAGCMFEVQRFPKDTSADVLREAVMTADSDAVIVQLPLPSGASTKEVCDAIPPMKDADVLSSVARAKFGRGDTDALLPPVVGALREIFIQNNVETKGRSVVVIGNGWLVGNPCAVWLRQQGADVEVITLESDDLRNCSTPGVEQLRAADIIISGAGVPNLIHPEYLKQGVVLIDAGSSEAGGVIVGDANPSCAEKCSVFTPVPGGIGPLAVACLFENAVLLASLVQQVDDKSL